MGFALLGGTVSLGVEFNEAVYAGLYFVVDTP